VSITIDGGTATFTSNSSGVISVLQNTAFNTVDTTGGITDCAPPTNPVSTGGPGFTTGSPAQTCQAPGNISLTVKPAGSGIPAGADTLSFTVVCPSGTDTVNINISGNGLPTPEAPSSVLFGAGAVLVLLALRRSRRPTITPV
jgi:hypothetical protein